jgi:hypothetical protein
VFVWHRVSSGDAPQWSASFGGIPLWPVNKTKVANVGNPPNLVNVKIPSQSKVTSFGGIPLWSGKQPSAEAGDVGWC